jgi:hypothetical protein
MKLSKACFGPRHCRLSTFCSHDRHRRRTPPVLRIAGSAKKVVVLHIRSDRNESSAAARSDGGCPQVVNEYRADRPSHAVTKIESGVGRVRRRPLSEQAPGDIGENKEANDDQGARDDAAQHSPRHANTAVVTSPDKISANIAAGIAI